MHFNKFNVKLEQSIDFIFAVLILAIKLGIGGYGCFKIIEDIITIYEYQKPAYHKYVVHTSSTIVINNSKPNMFLFL